MTSMWDKSKLQDEFPQCQTLKQVINSIETSFSGRGEVICEIRVNGMLLDEDAEHKFAESSTTEIDNITVRTNQPLNLIQEAIVSAYSFIPDLDRASVDAAEKFRSADLAPAQKAINEVIEGCQWLFDTLMHIRGAASTLHQPIENPVQWFEAEKLIGKAIKELTDAYSTSDFSLVADLLEYELTGALVVWKEVVRGECERRAPQLLQNNSLAGNSGAA